MHIIRRDFAFVEYLVLCLERMLHLVSNKNAALLKLSKLKIQSVADYSKNKFLSSTANACHRIYKLAADSSFVFFLPNVLVHVKRTAWYQHHAFDFLY